MQLSKKWCLSGAALLCAYISTRTQVILVHLHFLHERGHHEGEGLPVEVVEHVAHKHAEKYGPPVVSIARRGHGCRSRCRERVSQKHGNKSQLPLPPSSSESCACRPPACPPACDGDLCLGIRRAQRALERGGEVVFAISRGQVNGQPAVPDFIRLPRRYNTGELGGGGGKVR